MLGTSLPAAGISAPICTFGSLASAVVRLPRTVHQIHIFAGDNSPQSHRSQAVLERVPRAFGSRVRRAGRATQARAGSHSIVIIAAE